ncbi:GntR family transcriptional regulator [Microbacterium capsulatum]|uniref:GntR family transcriptional regulator n=1 Tax=Microbacterium capsulatum TaxID=3041921 RepID=A0ABU0XGC2_9MICO|nr:GntR family transcriptional regulator [Microbacterium sp. ASV81]MDQ4214180.1 GntR family transcriptional regulator [Microbacterium sp. ASV81]
MYKRVGASIIDGTLPPGYRIRDADLAEQFGVSRMPIREALQRLERIGLVEMYPSRYTQVTDVPPKLASMTRAYAGYLSGAIAALAVPLLSDEDREESARLARAMNDDLTVGLSDASWTFISHLAERSENVILAKLLDETNLLVFRNLRTWALTAQEQAHMRAIHEELAQAILDADGPAAEHLVRAMYLID